MAIQFIGEVEKTTDDSLPWINEFRSNSPDYEKGMLSPVQAFIKTPRGILGITLHYKFMLYSDSSIYEKLLEAVDVWIKNGLETEVQGIFATSDLKPLIGFDDDYSDVFVSVEKKGGSWKKVTVKWGKPSTSTTATAENPFLKKATRTKKAGTK